MFASKAFAFLEKLCHKAGSVSSWWLPHKGEAPFNVFQCQFEHLALQLNEDYAEVLQIMSQSLRTTGFVNPCNVLLVHVATKIESKQLMRIILRISDIDLIIIGSSLNNDSCRLHGIPVVQE